MTGRLTSRVETWIESALDKYALDDRPHVVWEQQFVMTQRGPQLGVMFFMPSGIMGTMVSTFTLVENPPMVTEDEIGTLASNALEALRKARSDALSGEVAAEGLHD